MWPVAQGGGSVTGSCGGAQWYYDSMRPWVHFVPVRADLSDLEQRFHWAEAHPHTADLCVEDPALDFPMDACLPYLFPLRSVRDECAARYDSLPYEYEGLRSTWLTAARAEQAKLAALAPTAQQDP